MFTKMHRTQKVASISILTAIAVLGLKLYAYKITQSIGILSDAIESLTNVATAVFALISLKVAAIPADQNHPYGHDKVEYFSSGIEGFLICLAAVYIFYNAYLRINSPQVLFALDQGSYILIIATLLNGLTAKLLFDTAKKYDSITLEADGKHLMTDVYSSIAIVFGIVLIKLRPEWQLIDVGIAFVLATTISITGIDLLRRSINGLMDVALPNDEVLSIQEHIDKTVEPEMRVENLRTRKSGAKRFIDFELFVPGQTTIAEVYQLNCKIKSGIYKVLANTSITIDVKPK